jgi:NAD(P)-dependent dehydrogenase (short-subunit alcohol dehydrogenase family)
VAKLTGKRVVVVGGTSGIGLATAAAASEKGASVVVASSTQGKVDAALTRLGDAAAGAVVDVTDEAGLAGFFDGLERIDHLFVTPSKLVPTPVAEARTEDVRPSLDLRFWAAFHSAKYAGAKIPAGGSITFMSGIAGTGPIPNEAVAGGSCAAVESLMRSLAIELAPVRVNALAPGFVDTPLLDGFFGDERAERIAAIGARLPVGRIGTAEEIAAAALFLMTNGYVNGHVLVIDGGHLVAGA